MSVDMKRWSVAAVLFGVALAFSAAAAEDRPQVYNVEVGPWRLEAEDYLWYRIAGIWDEPTASGGKVANRPGYGYMLLDDMPFPRTSRPVTIYVRVRPAILAERYTLLTTRNRATEDDNVRTRAVLTPTKVGEWQWMQFAPVSADVMGDSFAVQFVEQGATGIACDCVVISTRSDLTLAALEQAKPLVTSGPRAVVARTAAPPMLDGRGDDTCWQNTVACSDFLGMRAVAAAEARTDVRLCYDERNLYLLFTCQEPILKVAGQRLGDFVAKVTDRDGEVYADDSVVFLLDPVRAGKQVFDFTVNALGTVADARCPGPDLWETRDVTWNSGAQAKGNIGEGVWTAEMAIPLADLGGAPKPGDIWQVSLGRLAKARKETTSWNPCNRGFHDPIQWGSLVFGEATPGVLLRTPATLQLGKNSLAVTLEALAGKPSGAYLMVDIASPQTHMHSCQYRFIVAPEKAAETSCQFEARSEGEVSLQYAVLDAATLAPWYASPTLMRVAKTSLAQVKLACDGPYELTLNDEVISRGAKAAGEAIMAPLQTGANVFALKLEKGTAAISVEAPGSHFAAESWKVAAADTKDATRASLDDQTWAMAKKTGQDAQLGPIVGEPGEAVVLRRTLLWEKTRVWPTPEPAYYLARGPAQHLVVKMEGLAGKKLDGWTTCIATPPEFEVLGATGYYGGSPSNPNKFLCTQLGLQQVNGREMRVAKVVADKPVLAGRHYLFSLFDLFVRYREEAGDPKNSEVEFLYWSEANGGNVTEPPQRFRVRLLPKLAGRQPRQLTFQLWNGRTAMDDLALREEVLKCAQAAGFNDIVDSDGFVSEHFPKYGIRLTFTTNFAPGEMDLADYLKAHPDQRLITNQGKPADRDAGHHLNLMCMTALLGEGWPGLEAALKKRLDPIRPHTVDIDYEYGPYDGPHSCYCPRCLAAFREYAKLVADVPLDPQIVKDKYGPQWTDFMTRRVAMMFAKFKEAIHRLYPGTKFSVYSDYQMPYLAEMYGMDWHYIAELQACDRAGCGYGETEADIYQTVEALKGIPLVSGLLAFPCGDGNGITVTTPPTPQTKAKVLRHLLASKGGGVLVFESHSIDGRTWYAMAEVSRLAAAFEDAFLKGKPAALAGFDVTQAQTLRVGGTTLICALNITGKPAEYTLTLLADAGAGEEFYSGKKVAAGETVKCALEPGDAAVFVLRK